MRYVSTERNLVGMTRATSSIAIVSADSSLSRLYGKLLASEFNIMIVPVHGLLRQLISYPPDVVILDTNTAEPLVPTVDGIIRSFPRMRIITVGFSIPEEMLEGLARAGVVSHINRKLTQPRDVIIVVKQTLDAM